MKLPANSTQSTSNLLKSDEGQQDPDSDDPDLAQHHISARELHSAIQTIAKFKIISKQNQTSLKKKYKKVNLLFREMSTFFVNSHKKKVQTSRQQKILRAELRKKTTLCKKNQRYNELLALIGDPKTIIKDQPQILSDNEDNEVQLKMQPNQQLPQLNKTEGTVRPSTCYICLQKYTQIDDLYHSHCPKCAAFGKEKRFQTANLWNKTALVTGARLKIGYQITLKLLRDGATVYATTRFTNDALIRYQQQQDYQLFRSRLFLIQCDFLSSDQVTSLTQYIKQHVQHLDILIHNAAQTISRSPQFYTFQLTNQAKSIQQNAGNLVYFNNRTYPSLETQNQQAITQGQASQLVGLKHTDQFGQPLDLRVKNTWREKIEEVSLYDCMTTQVINSTVPFYITGQLRCIMGGAQPSWVINVSSMEGVFYRQYKSCYHPHTNMAKASLNMMTRTCSYDMSKNNIYMSSVDTGWVTNENPLTIAARMSKNYAFDPPLDCIEGAMRVLDPIYQGIKQGKYTFGKFLKNYKQSVW